MTKVYDRAYFQTWYRDPKKAIVRRADLERKVGMALGAAEHLIGRAVNSVLDVGCGEGSWQPILMARRPRLKYLGLDTSDYAIRRYGHSRNLRPGSWGQLGEVRFGGPFDLVVCSDALHYVPTPEFLRGLGGLPELVGGVAYLDFLGATGLVECGLGMWAAKDLAPALTAMEKAERPRR